MSLTELNRYQQGHLFAVTVQWLRMAVILLVGLIASHAGAAWQQPLTEVERSQVSDIIALDDIAQRSLLWERKALSQSVISAAHPLGEQILLVEIKETKTHAQSGERLVEVFSFDYDIGSTMRKLIDIDDRVVVATTEINSPHLPLNRQEIEYGKTIMWQDAAVLHRINDELDNAIDLSGDFNSDLSSIRVRVSVWIPSSADQSGASNCHQERCALISLFTEDSFSLSVEPVINLMRGQVYTDLVQ